MSRVLAREKAMEILRLLDVAVAIVEVVQSFHANGITHRSLTEERILLHADGRVVVLDFHNATTFVQERAPALMAAADMDMHYLAPEQTGRTNLLVDFRADLYALGALFYKMLTGRLPFASADSLELVHAQLASMPAPPSELVGSIPKVMGDIVMKLLAKSPDDRYQSAEGLLYDLNQCRAALRTEGVIPDFVIGGRDFSSTLHLPDDLFGREDQKQTLQRLVRSAVSGQSSIALVMGEPGIGKSALVASCLTDVFSARGVVLNGRFDSLGRDRPYHGIRQAIQSVVNQMMGESEELLSETRTRLVADVAEYASVLVSAFQELSEILQSEGSGNMSGAEFDRQLEEGFVRLLTSLAGGGPVVLALDDVQWADHASRRLISRMLSRRNMGSLLCLLSVREQEIDPLHPVLQIMKEQDNEHTVVIRLGPLSEEDIFEILTRTLRTEGAPVRQLATLLRAKTEGNPFFLRQYLRDLGNDGTLKAIDGKWVWDYSAIQSRSIADNVIDLVVTKILYEKG
ncbi:MAG TPA: AAA family ATPase, partial [Leptospiraceae bacterium]|nr:AAA family ATPase [Leptospiraceae bacterium]